MNTGIITVVIVAVFIFLRIKTRSSGVKNIDASTLRAMQKSEPIVLIDVRTPGEVAKGKIAKAKEINVTDLSFKQNVLKLDKSKTYVVYCRSGQRSSRACNIMTKAGFENVYNLQGGYSQWNA